MSLIIRHLNKNNIVLSDIINSACVHALSNENLYFKDKLQNEFSKVDLTENLILEKAENLIIIWDENQEENLYTISNIRKFKNQNLIPSCDEIEIHYGRVFAKNEQSYYMIKIFDKSFINKLYNNDRYLNIFKVPKLSILNNPANNILLSSKLQKIFNILVKQR